MMIMIIIIIINVHDRYLAPVYLHYKRTVRIRHVGMPLVRAAPVGHSAA